MHNPNWTRDPRTGARRRYDERRWRDHETGRPVERMTRGADGSMRPAPFDPGSSTRNVGTFAAPPNDVPAYINRLARRRRRNRLAKASRRRNRARS